jgi:predicted Zn-dependent peptidase
MTLELLDFHCGKQNYKYYLNYTIAMRKRVLPNGLTVISAHSPSKTATLMVAVNTGSIFETIKENGITHFVEHMVFEGTKKRNALQITNEIEGIGGEIGAYTSNERTCFYIKVLPRHLDRALDVLFDIMHNPIFQKASIEKERKVIMDEINLKHDEPRFYQWELFMKTLFPSHPVSYPISGTEQSIKSVDRNRLLDYHRRYYVPNNMKVVYAGPKNTAIENRIEKVFWVMKSCRIDRPHIPFPKSAGKKVVQRDVSQSYLVFGYQTVPRSNRDSYTLDVIRAIFGKGLSGRIVEEIRAKKGLAYEVGCQHEAGIDFGFFAVYLSTQRRNIRKCESIIRRHFARIGDLGAKELEEAKNYLEGEFVIEMEDNRKYADALAFWDYCCLNINLDDYLKHIRSVTKKDVVRVAKRYFSANPATAIIRQKSG